MEPCIYPFSHQTPDWPFGEPAHAEETGAQRTAGFREVRDQIAPRIDRWLGEADRAP